MQNTQDILVKKFKEGTLAPLYILYHDNNFNESSWIDEFTQKVTQLKEHPDVVILEREEKENQYKVNSSATLKLNQELLTNPIQLTKKLIFITSAHDLSDIVANKLLKVFEELSHKFCIFLVCPENAAILPTVLSRSVKLNLESPNSQNESQTQDSIQISSPFELSRFLKQNPVTAKNIEKKFIEQKIDEVLASAKNDLDSFANLDSTLIHLEQLENQSNFNNSKLHIITPFFK